MDEKPEPDLDLASAVVECEFVPPSERTLAAAARRGRRARPKNLTINPKFHGNLIKRHAGMAHLGNSLKLL
jgi:hypothetical protein